MEYGRVRDRMLLSKYPLPYGNRRGKVLCAAVLSNQTLSIKVLVAHLVNYTTGTAKPILTQCCGNITETDYFIQKSSTDNFHIIKKGFYSSYHNIVIGVL